MSIKSPSDSAVRAAAIDPSRSFIIQAPAGSGKTELLTDRILALLATVNRPEEIVAITFTRKAASEMHARVLGKLAGGQGECPPEAYKKRSWELAQKAMQRNDELGWNLLQYPARLSIRTIDSFCTYLVRAMPWLSALGGLPAIAENPVQHYEAAAKATLAMADENESVARFISHLDVNRQSAMGLLANMLASRDHWLPLLMPGSDVDQLLENLDRAVQVDLERLAEAMPPGWATTLAPMVSRAASVLISKGSTAEECILENWQGEVFDTDVSSLSQWQALAGMLLTKENKLRKTVTISQGFEAKSDYKDDFLAWIKAVPESEPWIAALADIRSAPCDGYSDEQQDTLRILIEVLWLAAAQLNVCFTEAAEVDFTEISRRALDALGQVDDPSDLLLALDTVIRHILVDEFQDTSQSQIQLLERLTSGWMPGDGRTLFLVGDPMQSIYRFRKAEVGLFLTVKEHGLGEVSLTPLELKDNFRSQANLVEWVNKTCRPIFPKEDHPGLGAIRYTDSVAFNDGIEGLGVEFHPVWALKGEQGDEAGDPGPVAESIAIQLAKEALLRNPDSAHPVAILVRARTHLDGIVHRLAQQNIPCRAVELVSLKSRQVVIDLAQLARALSHPADRLAWLSVLRSPLCGLTLNSLHALCGSDLYTTIPALLSQWLQQGAEDECGMDAMEARRLRHAAAVLLDSSNASGTIPFAAWLESCWQRLGGPAVYSSQSDATDAERLFRLIEELAPYGNLNPIALEDKLDKLYAAPNGSGRAVEVMTIHKSKGLEFDTVILTGLDRRPKADTPPLMRFEHSGGELLLGPIKHKVSDEQDPVSVYLAGRDKKRGAYEADRLLYVALTRARQQLHLIGKLGLEGGGAIKKPETTSLLGRLWEHMPPPQTPDPAELITGDAALDEARPQRMLVRMSAQSLPADAVPYQEARQVSTWTWRPESGNESMIGTVAHAWLERLGKEGVEAWSIDRIDTCLPIFRKQLSRAGVIGTAVDAAAQVLRDTLAATLASPKGQWLLWAARAHREWSLLDVSGRVSVIDLAISQEDDWLVVDYKTGVPHADETRDAFAARMRERYREQIERYCGHVSALDGRPARGALYFPRADVWVDY
ncbi:UvrD-helicase domain-containing protein [Pollutimonas bauzanensis]|uniref:UvrD-helicase domain-containing protein n=1 Tax=Pollutimonas bauzanensis TaxID=658167 RepID=UPI00334100D4